MISVTCPACKGPLELFSRTDEHAKCANDLARLVKAAENIVATPPIGSAMERWNDLNDAVAPFREKEGQEQ